MATLNRTDVDSYLASLQMAAPTVEVSKGVTVEDLDLEKDVEVQTDKASVKIVGCRECKRPLVVTMFFAAAKAICASCSGTHANEPGAHIASVGQPVPGQTDPAKAVNLATCLINPQFAEAICPLCIEPMELKSVNHNDNYGPGHWDYSAKGGPVYHQDAKGETVMHQCNHCRVVITMSTTAHHTFRRQNEVRPGKQTNGWGEINGVRDEHETLVAS